MGLWFKPNFIVPQNSHFTLSNPVFDSNRHILTSGEKMGAGNLNKVLTNLFIDVLQNVDGSQTEGLLSWRLLPLSLAVTNNVIMLQVLINGGSHFL